MAWLAARSCKVCCGRQARETWAQEPLERKRVVVSCPILLLHQVSVALPAPPLFFRVPGDSGVPR